MTSDENNRDLSNGPETERQAAGESSPEEIVKEKRRDQAIQTQARIDQAAATPNVNSQWMFGGAIALIPLFVALYFVLFWEPNREPQEDTVVEEPVRVESREYVPMQPEPLPPEPPALPPHLRDEVVKQQPPETETTPKANLEQPAEQQVEAIEDLSPQKRELPNLDYSDDEVLDALSSLSPVLDWYIWLYTDEVVRKFVAIIDNISYGRVANKYISIPKPSKAFRGVQQGDKQYITPESYKRYDAYADIFAQLDNDDLVATYSYYFPLLEEAYVELGYPDDRRFHSTMIQAIDMILDAPVVDGEIELVPSTAVLYKFANPALESLPEVQKQMIRMGPRNTALIQSKLSTLRRALIR